MTEYTTMTRLRMEAQAEFDARRRALSEAKQPDRQKLSRLDPAVYDTPEFHAWVSDAAARRRKAKLLLTERQFADMRAGRSLQEGDRVTFVGETRDETSRATGRVVTRPHGQVGTIVRVDKTATVPIYLFLPDISQQTRDAAAAGLDIEVMTLETPWWTEFERIVES